ncbi:TetR/AcrR family transcriptional regulator [Rubrivivax albus]|uniref:TetR/AcrR family transcriptional regulator n=1 Tax=Rubrivivax albus TaxID=2499835 RepID=A0A3S2U8F1_9BURK|nr:TetR/AcrR family transcriptional regulator [Rubrivivax albus]RVT51046.1 TetR/AcrR family transcriptional regulator [Rubrivivax albus]
MTSSSVKPEGDHRTVVAAARRDRMRTHLIESALRAVLAQGSVSVPLESLLVHADVSRGTFYKYFPDVRALVQSMATTLSGELIAALHPMVESIDDPAERLATGMLTVLGLVQRAPMLGHLLANSSWLLVQPDEDHPFLKLVRSDVERGQRTRRFARMDLPLAMELLAAHVVAASRRLAGGGDATRLARQTVTALLRCLGVEDREARRLAEGPVRLANVQPGPLLTLAASNVFKA